ncbi:hypothetical protein PCS70012_02320, partial [Streptococcus pneumoniae PCS70012]
CCAQPAPSPEEEGQDVTAAMSCARPYVPQTRGPFRGVAARGDCLAGGSQELVAGPCAQ